MVCLWDIVGGWSFVGRCRCTSEVRGDSLMAPDHSAIHVRSSWSSLNWSVFLGKPNYEMPRESSGSLSIQPLSCTPWCSADTQFC